MFSKNFEYCKKIAEKSTCFRSKCGAIIVKDKLILGKGFNSPPNGEILKFCKKDKLPADFKSDKTCCVHAEQRAIIDAYENGYTRKDFEHSAIVFVRLNEEGKIEPSGKPYCTICSKMWMDVSNGKGSWILFHKKEVWGEEGVYIYNVVEYNNISFET